jgi:hypothetical protein
VYLRPTTIKKKSNNKLSNNNVVDFNTKRGPKGPIPPNFPPPTKLPQYNYKFVVVNKLYPDKEREFTERGHLIVTQLNIALLDENQEIRWSIPNDGSIIYFERIDEPASTNTGEPEQPLLDLEGIHGEEGQ